MARVQRTEQAEQDLEETLDYLEDHSPASAARFATLFKEKTEALARMPEMGRSREELAPSLRSFTAGNYLIFYRPTDDGILVIRVAHGSRDLPSLFEV
jgi:toxin ParE1/3/4